MVSSFSLVTRTRHRSVDVFDLSLSIDAHLGSMASSRERAVAGVTSGAIGLGESVTWRARHFGVWFRLTSTITALERPSRFVDEQTRGPFRLFRHEHTFTDASEGAVMIDTITLASPVFGRLAERFVLVPYLRRLIEQRNRHLLELLDAGSPRD